MAYRTTRERRRDRKRRRENMLDVLECVGFGIGVLTLVGVPFYFLFKLLDALSKLPMH